VIAITYPCSAGRLGGVALAHTQAHLVRGLQAEPYRPLAWLTATHAAITTGHPSRRPDDLLPWNVQPQSS
jgi:hypothetical protein